MRSHSSRSAIALFAVLAFALLAGCGDKDSSNDSSGSPSATAPSTGDSAADDGGGDDKAPVEVPTSGTPFNEVLDDDSLTTEQISELQITLTVLGMDRAGYVSGSTIVAQTSEDDLEDRQFTCIAAGQANKKDNQYTIVVVDETGKDLGC